MKISVIMPCHNGQDFVGDAISSALAQTHEDIEVIVVNDASTDRSAEVIDRFARKDRRVRPLHLSRNSGAAAARNCGISQATGEWVAMLDADDLYERDRIEQLLKVTNSTDAEIVVDRQVVQDLATATPPFLSFEFLARPEPVLISPELYFSQSAAFHREPNIGYMKPMFRRSYLLDNKLGFNEDYEVGEDAFLYEECVCRKARFFGTSYAGYVYRRRAASLSRAGTPFVALQPLTKMCDEIVDRYGPALSSDVKGLIEKRKRILERFVVLMDMAAAVRSRSWVRFLHTGISRPDIALLGPILLRKWLARLEKRTGGFRQERNHVTAKAPG